MIKFKVTNNTDSKRRMRFGSHLTLGPEGEKVLGVGIEDILLLPLLLVFRAFNIVI